MLNIQFTLMVVATGLLPVYAFSSGGIQPAHIFFAIFSVIIFILRGIPKKSWALLLLAISIHVFMLESILIIQGGNPEYLINGIFFLYNFIISCAIYLYFRSSGLSALVPGLMIASGIALATIVILGVDLHIGAEGGRATGTFNNPNQLGYFSVCLLSLTYLLYRHGHFHYIVAAGVFAVAIFLSIASLSKAAMVSNFVVVFLALKPAASRSSVFVWVLSLVVAIFILMNLSQRGFFDDYIFMTRLANMGQESDSSLSSRGYFAFLEGNIYQIIFGMGAEKINEIVGHEVHSTIASVLNNYGLLGLSFFGGVLTIWGVRLWQAYGFVGSFCLFAPAMLYGITHNGTRFTIFWLLFAASLAMANRILAMGNPRLDFKQK